MAVTPFITDAEATQKIQQSYAQLQTQLDAIAGGSQGFINTTDVKTEIGYYYPTESGTYTNAGGLVVDLTDGVTILIFDGTNWGMQVVPVEADYLYNIMGLPDYRKNIELTNILSNNNFTSLWGGNNYVSGGVSGNIYTWTATAPQGRVQSSFTSVLGDKYYCKLSVKADSPLVGILTPGVVLEKSFHSGSGNFEILSFSFTGVANGIRGFYCVDNNVSGWTPNQIKKGLIVNLTEAFGGGNEPSEEVFEEMISSYPDLWFGGEEVVSDALSTTGQTFVNNNGIMEFIDFPNLLNKKIVCFGDSIIQQSNIHNVLTRTTIAPAHNVGFGGTRMAAHPTPAWDAFSMYRLAESISTNDFTLQDANETVSSTFPDILADLKSIDFSTVDIITINHSQNDFSGNTILGDTSSTEDGNTFAGAMKYIINLIQSAYPHITIIFFTAGYRARLGSGDPIPSSNSDDTPNSNGDYLIEFVDLMKSVVNSNHIPVFDFYRNCGINIYNYELFLSDGLHLTKKGDEKMIKKFINFLTINQ